MAEENDQAQKPATPNKKHFSHIKDKRSKQMPGGGSLVTYELTDRAQRALSGEEPKRSAGNG